MLSAKKIRCLVIDDEPAIRKLLERGLSSSGYEVTAVSNGTTARLRPSTSAVSA